MKVLINAEVALGSLNGLMAQREADLVHARTTLVGEFSEGAAQVMRGERPQPLRQGIAAYNLMHCLGRQGLGRNATTLVNSAEQRGCFIEKSLRQ